MKTVRIIPKEVQATRLQNVAEYARVSRDFEPKRILYPGQVCDHCVSWWCQD